MSIDQLNIYRNQGNFKKIIEIITDMDEHNVIECQLIEIESLIGLNNYKKALNEINSLYNLKNVIKQNNIIRLSILNIECLIMLNFSKEEISNSLKKVDLQLENLINSTIPIYDEQIKFLNIKGHFYLNLGDVESSLEFFQQSLKESYRLNNKFYQSKNLITIARVYCDSEQYDKSLEHTMKSLAISTSNNFTNQTAIGYEILGLLNQKNNLNQSLKYLNLSLKICRDDLKDQILIAKSLYYIGTTLILKNDLDHALENLQKSFTIFDSLSIDSQNLLPLLKAIGDIFIKKRKFMEAIEYYNKSLKFSANKNLQADVLYSIGNAYFKIGNHKESLNYYNDSLAIKQSFKNRMEIAGVLWGLGHIYFIKRNFNKAIEYYTKLMRIYEVNNKTNYLSEVLLIIITLCSSKKEFDKLNIFFKKLKQLDLEISNSHVNQSCMIASAIINQNNYRLDEFIALDTYENIANSKNVNSYYKNFSILNAIKIYVNEFDLTRGENNKDQNNEIMQDIVRLVKKIVSFNEESNNFTLYLYGLLLQLILHSILDNKEIYENIEKEINSKIKITYINKVTDDIIKKMAQITKLRKENDDKNLEFKEKIYSKIKISKLVGKLLEEKYWLR